VIIRRVTRVDPSPLRVGQGVMTLECGHLRSYGLGPAPVGVGQRCVDCDDEEMERLRAIERAAREVTGFAWGRLVTEEVHSERVAKMEALRAALGGTR
jgi:hypothetical protein